MDLTNLNRKNSRRKTEPDLSTMIYGKMPPQAKDLEEAVLGALMLEKDAFEECVEYIKVPDMFYVDSHRRIFEAICNLKNRTQPTDILSVVEELRKMEVLDLAGGPYFVTKLTNNVVSGASVAHHSRIIFQKYIQREMIRVAGLMITEAYEDRTDPFELMDTIEAHVLEISNSLQRKQGEDISGALVTFIRETENKRLKPEELTGVPSGFPKIDKLTHGWQPTDLIVIAARPSVGKTALAINLARNAALSKVKPTPVAFFSLEMSTSQLVQRLVSAESEVPLTQIQRGQLEEEHMKTLYQKGIQALSNAPIFIDDTPGLNIFELRAKCRRLKNKMNVGMIIIDYLQLMSGMGGQGNREQEISQISRGLKSLAKELQVPVIALSQLSREPEKRTNKVPMLSDLRESGAIEQDADVVAFLYRPDYYNPSIDSTGETEVRFAKHRNGTLETITLKAQLYIQKFIQSSSIFNPSPIYNGNGLDFKAAQAGGMLPKIGFGSQLNDAIGEEDPF